MLYKTWLFTIPLLLLGVITTIASPVAADSQPASALPQVVYATPTARPDGHIVYIVQDGDTCLRIQLLTQVTIDQIRSLNKLDQNCTIQPKQELLLAVVTPSVRPTQNPQRSATPLLPTQTPPKGNGKICVLLFEDINGDGVRQESEGLMIGGAVSLTDRDGQVSKTGLTTDSAEGPYCEEVPEGDYNISMAVPGGYNATTLTNRPLQLPAGDQQIVEFGAQLSSKVTDPQAPQQPESNNLILAILGGVFLLFGAGLGIYVAVTRK